MTDPVAPPGHVRADATDTSSPSSWDPAQYERFAAERTQPFRDLLALVDPVPGGRVVDLGCGAGRLTLELHHQTGAATTLGLDTSDTFMAEARALDGPVGVTFEQGDLRDAPAQGPFDLAFSNAVLHWVPDHEAVLAHLTGALAPGGQLAIQVPANFDHASHTAAADVLKRTEFREAGGPRLVTTPGHHLLTPERYSTVLHDLDYERHHVRLQVYGHLLDSTAQIVEWTSGSLLTPVRSAMANDPERYERFVDQYRQRLIDVLGDHAPYYFTFKRLLIWARRPA